MMATGITKRHAQRCRHAKRGQLQLRAEVAGVGVVGEGRPQDQAPVRHPSPRRKSWRADAKRELDRGTMLPPAPDGRRLADALGEFVEGMRSGEVRPGGGSATRPGPFAPTTAR